MSKVENKEAVYRIRALADYWVLESDKGVVEALGRIGDYFPTFTVDEENKGIWLNGTNCLLTDKQYRRLVKDIKRVSFVRRWKPFIGTGFLIFALLFVYTAYHVSIFAYQQKTAKQSAVQNSAVQMLLQQEMANSLAPALGQPPVQPAQGLDEAHFWQQIESMQR